MHQTILNEVRTSLNASRLPAKLWGEAIQFVTFIHNRTPRAATQSNTPYYKHFSKAFKFTDIHEFGQHVIIYNKTADKSQNRGIPGQFVGYDHESKGYRIYWNQKVTVEHNLQFLDEPYPQQEKSQ